MSAQPSNFPFRALAPMQAQDGPTVPPNHGEMDELLDACGRRASAATIKVRRSEIDSLKNLAVAVAIDPDDSDASRYMHLRVTPPSMPRMRSTEAERASTKSLNALNAAAAAKAAAAATTKVKPRHALLPPKVQARVNHLFMWAPAAALTVSIGWMTAMASGPRTATAAAAGAAAPEQPAVAVLARKVTAPQARSTAVINLAPHVIEETATSPMVHRAAPVAQAADPVAAAENVSFVSAVLPATGAAASCEAGADDGSKSLARGDFAAAEAAFARVTACNPNYLPARIGRADAAWAAGDHDRAAGYYRRIVDDMPDATYPQRVTARATPSP